MTVPATGKRETAERRGREGEAQAAQWLAARGWQIVAERVKTPLGEIDLIARKAGLVAFVEVKWRRSITALGNAVDERRLARVAAAVGAVGHEYAGPADDMRIDVILLAPGARPRHIENAWMP